MNKHGISPFMPPQHASQYTLLKKTIEIYCLPCNNTVPLLNAVKILTVQSRINLLLVQLIQNLVFRLIACHKTH